ELAFELAVRMENPCDSVKNTEIGVVECICPIQWCVSWFTRYPWSKITFADYLTWRFRVCQFRLVFHGDTYANGCQLNVVQTPTERHLFLVCRQNREIRISDEHLFNDHARFHRAVLCVSLHVPTVAGPECWPLTFRRNVDFHSVKCDQTHA